MVRPRGYSPAAMSVRRAHRRHRLIAWAAPRKRRVQPLRRSQSLAVGHDRGALNTIIDKFGRPTEPITVSTNSRKSADAQQ